MLDSNSDASDASYGWGNEKAGEPAESTESKATKPRSHRSKSSSHRTKSSSHQSTPEPESQKNSPERSSSKRSKERTVEPQVYEYQESKPTKTRSSSHRGKESRSHRGEESRSHRGEESRSHRGEESRSHRGEESRSHRGEKSRSHREEDSRPHREEKSKATSHHSRSSSGKSPTPRYTDDAPMDPSQNQQKSRKSRKSKHAIKSGQEIDYTNPDHHVSANLVYTTSFLPNDLGSEDTEILIELGEVRSKEAFTPPVRSDADNLVTTQIQGYNLKQVIPVRIELLSFDTTGFSESSLLVTPTGAPTEKSELVRSASSSATGLFLLGRDTAVTDCKQSYSNEAQLGKELVRVWGHVSTATLSDCRDIKKVENSSQTMIRHDSDMWHMLNTNAQNLGIKNVTYGTSIIDGSRYINFDTKVVDEVINKTMTIVEQYLNRTDVGQATLRIVREDGKPIVDGMDLKSEKKVHITAQIKTTVAYPRKLTGYNQGAALLQKAP